MNKEMILQYFFQPIDAEKNAVNSNHAKLLSNTLFSIISISLLSLILYLAWSLDRGFDITDEAFYITNAMYPESIKAGLTFQHWLLAPLWNLSGTLTSFRAVGLLLLIFSSSILTLGFLNSCQSLGLTIRAKSAPYIILFSTVTAALLYNSMIPTSPSYNLLASAFTYLAIGFCLLSAGKTLSISLVSLFVFIGVSISCIFIAKFSSAVTALFIVLIYICIFSSSIKEKIVGLITIFFTSVFTTLGFIYYYSSLDDVVDILTLGSEVRSLGRESNLHPITLIIRYFTDYFRYLMDAFDAFVIPLLTMFAYVVSKQRVFAALSIISLVTILVLNGYLEGGSTFINYTSQMLALIALLIISLLLSFKIWTKNISTFLLFFGLFLLPYSIAIGTGNKLHWHVITSLASWGTIMTALACIERPKNQNQLLGLSICCLFSLTITFQVTSIAFGSPYHLNSPIVEQLIPVKIGNIGTVKVDEDTKKFIDNLSAAVEKCNILPNTPYIGLYNNIGVALAIKGQPFVAHWVDTLTQAQFVLNNADPSLRAKAVVGLRHWVNEQGKITLPDTFGNFGKNYRLCGVATYPFMNQPIGIYKPNT